MKIVEIHNIFLKKEHFTNTTIAQQLGEAFKSFLYRNIYIFLYNLYNFTYNRAEDEGVANIEDGISTLDISRVDRNVPSSVDADDKGTAPPTPADARRKAPKSSSDRWLHDKYNENDQVGSFFYFHGVIFTF